jgi:hypothetical protein
MATFLPSTYPASLRPLRKLATISLVASSEEVSEKPDHRNARLLRARHHRPRRCAERAAPSCSSAILRLQNWRVKSGRVCGALKRPQRPLSTRSSRDGRLVAVEVDRVAARLEQQDPGCFARTQADRERRRRRTCASLRRASRADALGSSLACPDSHFS